MMATERPPRHRSSLRGYLARILRNTIRLQRRSSRRRQLRESAVAEHAITATEPIELVAKAELHGALVAAVLRLPEVRREIVLLHHYEGLAVAEVAGRTGRSPDAVRAMLRRARDELRDDLERSGTWSALSLLVLPVAAVPAAFALPLSLGVFVMKWKAMLGVATVVLAYLLVPWVGIFDSGGDVITQPGGVAPVESAVEAAHATGAAKAPEVQRVLAPLTGRQLEGRLRGGEDVVPWSSNIATMATWHESGAEKQRKVVAEVRADGSFLVALPMWSDQCSDLRLQCLAEDPWYESLDTTLEFPSGTDDEFDVLVEPAPQLFGRVVDQSDHGIVAARVLVYAAKAGVPRTGIVAEARSVEGGRWRLRLPADGDVFAVFVPPKGRPDLVVSGETAVVFGATDIGAVALATAAMVTGTVRWSTGKPIPEAVVSWGMRTTVKLDEELRIGWHDGRVVQRHEVAVDVAGRFALPAGKGDTGTVLVQRAAGCLPSSFAKAQATAPQEVDLFVEGHPVTVSVLRDGRPATRSGIEWQGGLQFLYGTDEHGELRVLANDEALRLRAFNLDRSQTSEWVAFTTAVPERIVLQLLPAEGQAVSVRLEGAAVSVVAFVWQPVDGSAACVTTLAGESGKFTMRVPNGRYRLRLLGVEGQASSYLLPVDQEVALPASADVTVAVRLGGRVRLVATDAKGAFVGGSYQVLRDGTQVVLRLGNGRAATANRLGDRGPHVSAVYPPGNYEFVVDLGAHGEHRRTVRIEAGDSAELRIVVP